MREWCGVVKVLMRLSEVASAGAFGDGGLGRREMGLDAKRRCVSAGSPEKDAEWWLGGRAGVGA